MSILGNFRVAAGRTVIGIGRRLGAFAGGTGPYFYEGANWWSKDRTYIQTNTGDAIEALPKYTRTTLLGLSRALYGNVGFVKGGVDDIARHSIGCGIFPHSAIKDKGKAKTYDDWLKQWWLIPEITGRFTMAKIQEMASVALDVDGDMGFLLTETETGYPQLQAVESHRIESDPEQAGYKDGVKINGDGRPVAFSIRYSLPDGAIRFRRIPASSFIHVAELERFSGVRGASGLKHAINNLRDIKDILSFEKAGVKANSAIAFTIKLANAAGMAGGFFSSQQSVTGANGSALTFETLRGGAIPKLLQGEELASHESARPSPTFGGFLEDLRRDVAVGLGVPLEFLWDSSKLGGTTQRFTVKKAEKRCEQRQETTRLWTLRARNWAIAKAIKRGDLPEDEEWWRVRWQNPSKLTVDVGRDAAANRDDVTAGLRTEQEDYEERGREFDVERDSIEAAADDKFTRAARLFEKHKASGLTFQQALDHIGMRGNGGSPPAQPAQRSTPKPTVKTGESE